MRGVRGISEIVSSVMLLMISLGLLAVFSAGIARQIALALSGLREDFVYARESMGYSLAVVYASSNGSTCDLMLLNTGRVPVKLVAVLGAGGEGLRYELLNATRYPYTPINTTTIEPLQLLMLRISGAPTAIVTDKGVVEVKGVCG